MSVFRYISFKAALSIYHRLAAGVCMHGSLAYAPWLPCADHCWHVPAYYWSCGAQIQLFTTSKKFFKPQTLASYFSVQRNHVRLITSVNIANRGTTMSDVHVHSAVAIFRKCWPWLVALTSSPRSLILQPEHGFDWPFCLSNNENGRQSSSLSGSLVDDQLF
jgi:hypothetical protein